MLDSGLVPLLGPHLAWGGKEWGWGLVSSPSQSLILPWRGKKWVLSLSIIPSQSPIRSCLGSGWVLGLGLIPLPRPHPALEWLLGLQSFLFPLKTPSCPGLGAGALWFSSERARLGW